MYEANVLGTERVLRAALAARTPKVVYVSTVGAFGNTHGEVVDETYEHPGQEFTSYYEETKYEAHQVAKPPDRRGGPAVRDRPAGRRLRARRPLGDRHADQRVPGRADAADAFPDLGMNMVHVEDVADGILLALDKGPPARPTSSAARSRRCAS